MEKTIIVAFDEEEDEILPEPGRDGRAERHLSLDENGVVRGLAHHEYGKIIGSWKIGTAGPTEDYKRGVYDVLRAIEVTQRNCLNTDFIANMGDEILRYLDLPLGGSEEEEQVEA